MAIPKRLEEIIEEQKALKEASLWGDIAAVGATALAVGQLGLDPAADAAAAGLDAAAVGGAAADAAGAGEAAAGEAANAASKGPGLLSRAWKGLQNYNTIRNVLPKPAQPAQQQQPTQQQAQPLSSYDLTPQFSTQGPADPNGSVGTTGFKRIAFQPMTTVPMDDMQWLSPAPQVFNPSAPLPNLLDTAVNFALDHPQLTKSVGKEVVKGVGQVTHKMFMPKPSTTPTVEPLKVPGTQEEQEPATELKTTERTPEDSREVGKETEVEAQTEGARDKPPAGPKAPSDTKASEQTAPEPLPAPVSPQRSISIPKGHPKGFSVPEPLFQTRGPMSPQLASVQSNRLFELLEEDHYRTASIECTGCGANNASDALSCTSCNRPTNAVECPGCGSSNSQSAANCRACNRHLGSKNTTWDIIEPTVWY
jgi:hypothetical protein